MWKIWSENLRKNMVRALGNQGESQKKIKEKNCQVGIWQKCYMDGMTEGLTRNVGDGWREIG